MAAGRPDASRECSLARVRNPLAIAALVLVLALIGISTRPPGLLATFWTANAVLLALLVRWPRLFTAPTVLSAYVAFVCADLVTGSDLLGALGINLCNVTGVLAAVLVARFAGWTPLVLASGRDLGRVAVLAPVAVAVSAATAALTVRRSGVGQAEIGLTWLATDLTNYVLVLPLVLSFGIAAVGSRRRSIRADLRAYAIPVVAIVAAVVIGSYVHGPLALVLPLPALLWCATRVSIFGTTLIALMWSSWTLAVVVVDRAIERSVDNSVPDWTGNVSMTVAVAMVALGPIVVAILTRDRDVAQEELRHALRYDELTGALARRAFLDRGDRRVAELQDCAQPVALLMIDLDHFKSVNDTLGHAAGDAALRASAESMMQIVPDDAFVGRLGGEEFAVLIPRRDRATVERLAESIRSAQELSGTTLSIGVVWADPAPATVGPLMITADRSLYDAKHKGRNTVVSSTMRHIS